jgi:polar amino acid transport system substrate-binding protein
MLNERFMLTARALFCLRAMLLCAVALLPVSTLASPTSAPTKTITVAADKWCPYNCAENDKKPGYIIELIRKALEPLGVKVVYKVIPWSDAIERTRKGEFDAIVGANTGDAPDFIFPDQLQGISLNLVWVRANDPFHYSTSESLKGKKLGIVRGFSYGKEMDKFISSSIAEPNHTIMKSHSSTASEDNIKKLLSGELDVILEDKNVVQYYFSSRGMPIALKPAGNPVNLKNHQDTFVFVAFSPANPDAKLYAEALSKAVVTMRDNGELTEILANYGMNSVFRYVGEHPEESK